MHPAHLRDAPASGLARSECPICGAAFTPSRSWQVFDKEACRRAAHRKGGRAKVPTAADPALAEQLHQARAEELHHVLAEVRVLVGTARLLVEAARESAAAASTQRERIEVQVDTLKIKLQHIDALVTSTAEHHAVAEQIIMRLSGLTEH